MDEKGIRILFSAMIGPVRDVLMRSGFMNEIGETNQFMSIVDAVNYINSSDVKNIVSQNHVLQYNERRFLIIKRIRRFVKRK